MLDRLCREAPQVLAPAGTILLVQSALSGITATRHLLENHGLSTHVAARCTHPFGPVLTVVSPSSNALASSKPGAAPKTSS